MPVNYKEIAFEKAIEASLLQDGGYEKGEPANFDPVRCLDALVLIPFIETTQSKVWDTIVAYHGENAQTVLLDDLARALSSQGMLDVLRHGFKCFGKLVHVAFFKPANRMNPETEKLYRPQRHTASRQSKHTGRLQTCI